MKKTGYLYDNRYLLHDTGPCHPEVPERLIAINKGIKQAGLLENLISVRAVSADLKWVKLVHDIYYIERFKKKCASGSKTFIYSDNQICKNTYEIANLAVGGILRVTDKVMKKELDNVFCAVRPPGHHAEHDRAMGFCYFNNIAITASYLKKKWNIKKIGIIDFDVHHGNGTQHIFEKDPQVLYYSIHQHPSFSFPGTGEILDKGIENGYGFTKNSTILPGQGDNTYYDIIKNDLLPIFENYKPEIILISTGFDAHKDDFMSSVNLSNKGFAWITRVIFELAEKYSKGRIISILEGGYCLKRLPELAVDHVKILINKKNNKHS